MRRMLALLLCLMLPLCALAAPVRDSREGRLTKEDLFLLRELLDAYVYAAVTTGQRAMAVGSQPNEEYEKALMLRVAQRGFLGVGGGLYDSVTLEKDELDVLYAALFADGKNELPSLQLNLAAAETKYIGAYVYFTEEEGGCVIAYADVYEQEGYDSLPQDTPENALAYRTSAALYLERNEDTDFGYTLLGYELGEDYEAAQWETHTDETLGFEVSAPSFLTAESSTVLGWQVSSQDGSVTLAVTRVSFESGLAKDYAEELLKEDGTLEIEVREDLKQVIAKAPGLYIAAMIADGEVYTLTLSYPPQKETEYNLYAEFMRNSFVVYSVSVG